MLLLYKIFSLIVAILFCLVRELLSTKKRQDDTYDSMRAVLGDSLISCDIEMVGPEITACSQGSTFLPPEITEDMLKSKMFDHQQSGSVPLDNVSVTVDNSLSPAHTLVQIVCQDHKGLLYDIMRTLKDFNIQVNYRIYISINITHVDRLLRNFRGTIFHIYM